MTSDTHRAATPPELAATADALMDALDALRARSARTVIGIAGESGSGKTTTALALSRALAARGRAPATLHQDDYFLRPPRLNHEFRRRHPESVGPGEVNLALLGEHLAAFRAGRSGVLVPVVDAEADRFDARTRDFSGVDVLVVEGTYVLLLDDVDVGIFLSATHEQTHARRLVRARDVFEPFVEDVLRTEHAVIAPQRARASLVVDEHGTVHRRV